MGQNSMYVWDVSESNNSSKLANILDRYNNVYYYHVPTPKYDLLKV